MCGGGRSPGLDTVQGGARPGVDPADGKSVWLGGKYSEQEGKWSWTDGSPWNYTAWIEGYGSRGDGRNCAYDVQKHLAGWTTLLLPIEYTICVFDPSAPMTGNTSLVLTYTREQIAAFSSFNVWYSYKAASEELLDSWEDPRMTGFTVSWYIRAANGSLQTETQPSIPGLWKPLAASPKYQEPYLVKMVNVARQARARNKTGEEILSDVIEAKERMLESGVIQSTGMCSGGQVRSTNYKDCYDRLTNYLGYDDSNYLDILDEDIKHGFEMFTALIDCSESVKLYQFLHTLISTQSPRTIIQTTVNTIQNDKIMENSNRKRFNQFYLILEKKFHFQLGKILLAISTKTQLKDMKDKDWPYFSQYSQEMDQCLSGESCQGMMDIVQGLGE